MRRRLTLNCCCGALIITAATSSNAAAAAAAERDGEDLRTPIWGESQSSAVPVPVPVASGESPSDSGPLSGGLADAVDSELVSKVLASVLSSLSEDGPSLNENEMMLTETDTAPPSSTAPRKVLSQGTDRFVCDVSGIDLEIAILFSTRNKDWWSNTTTYILALQEAFASFKSVKSAAGSFGWIQPSSDPANTVEYCGSVLSTMTEDNFASFDTILEAYAANTEDGSSAPATQDAYDNIWAGWQMAWSAENPFNFSTANSPSVAKIVATVSPYSVPWSSWMQGEYHSNGTGKLARPYFRSQPACADPQMDLQHLHLAFSEEHQVAQMVLEELGPYPSYNITAGYPCDQGVWCHMGVPTSRYLANYLDPMPGYPTVVNCMMNKHAENETAYLLFEGVQNSVCSMAQWWESMAELNKSIHDWNDDPNNHYDPTAYPYVPPATFPYQPPMFTTAPARSNGWIAGVVIGGLGASALIGAGCYYLWGLLSPTKFASQRGDAAHPDVFEIENTDAANWQAGIAGEAGLDGSIVIPAGMVARTGNERRGSMEGFMEDAGGFTLIQGKNTDHTTMGAQEGVLQLERGEESSGGYSLKFQV